MLCQQCQNKTATFHYHENINGETHNLHLCADCAKNLRHDFKSRQLDTLRAMFSAAPPSSAVGLMEKDVIAPRKTTTATPLKEKPITEMSMEELQMKMNAAVRTENYEEAAKLRDEMKRRNSNVQ